MEHFIWVMLAFAAWLAQRINSARKKEAARRNGQPVPAGPHGDFESAREPERSWFERETRPAPAPVTAAAAAPVVLPQYGLGSRAPAPLPATLPALVEAAAPARAGAVWLEELRQPAAARRAILLTEILGRPVGLRD